MEAGGEEEGIGLPAEVLAKVATAKRRKIGERPRGSLDDDDGWSAATTARKRDQITDGRPDNLRQLLCSSAKSVDQQVLTGT
jgi:hypothetical protein